MQSLGQIGRDLGIKAFTASENCVSHSRVGILREFDISVSGMDLFSLAGGLQILVVQLCQPPANWKLLGF